MPLFQPRKTYKPIEYDWARQAALDQHSMHWLPQEVAMGDDITDWKSKLNDGEREFLLHILRFFTQADLDVCQCYINNYLGLFKVPEIEMMLAAFANMETIHTLGYAHLLESLCLPDSEFEVFMEYKAMREKHEYLLQFNSNSLEDIAVTLGAYGAFVEGMQLFSTFAMLLNFPRLGLMRGMGQIVTWSVRDETLHMLNIIRLFHTLLHENPQISRGAVNERLIQVAIKLKKLEFKFIELAFENYKFEGMKEYDIKQYITFITNDRCQKLGLEFSFPGGKNLDWIQEQLNSMGYENFFECRATEYGKSTNMQGDWEDVF